MATTVKGPLTWDLSRDEEGHRDYTIVHLIKSDSVADGPAIVMLTPGLPIIGSVWNFGSDLDPWALCWPDMKASPVIKNEPGYWWEVEQKFTTRPIKRCQDTSIENPLLEPDRVSGSFVKFQVEAVRDRNGVSLKNSAHERFRGSLVEFDNNRPTVTIEKNLGGHPLLTYAPMIDTVNDSPLWGLPVRTVKLSNVSWERKYFGVCTVYYTVRYEFEINYNTFDRTVDDWGKRVLAPGGNANDPNDFVTIKDIYGENAPEFVPLDGSGNISSTGVPASAVVEYYAESNMFTLGIPATL